MTGPTSAPSQLIIASRESRLAMWQAEHVQGLLRNLYPACAVTILGMTTEGDRVLGRPLAEIGGKGLFTKELETALADGRADLAVHSLKDVPVELPPGFELTAVLGREDPRDAFVSHAHEGIEALPPGARVGTSSLRRAAQIRQRHPHLQVLPLRGNVNTRLAKLDRGEYEAIVLASAGLKRLGLAARIRQILPTAICLPAAGQGALGIEILEGRPDLAACLAPLCDEASWAQVTAERRVSEILGGSCRIPIAAFCEPWPDGGLRLRALVARTDGSEFVAAEGHSEHADRTSAFALGDRVARQLVAAGALELLARDADAAPPA